MGLIKRLFSDLFKKDNPDRLAREAVVRVETDGLCRYHPLNEKFNPHRRAHRDSYLELKKRIRNYHYR